MCIRDSEAWSKGTATPSVTLDIGEMDVWPSDLYQAELKHDKLSGLLSSSSRVAADARVGISIPILEMGAQHKSITVTFDQESNELHFVSHWEFSDSATKSIKNNLSSPRWTADAFRDHIAQRLQQILIHVRCLPADRAGLLLAADAGVTKLDLPRPLNAFLDDVRCMRANPTETTLWSQIQPLLNKITAGTIGLTESNGTKKIIQEVAGRHLPIAVASSLSRSIAGLEYYIHTSASPGDVVIIDELEMNAHPAAQLSLVELMAVMVNHGIRIIFTTHSPYVVDHLNNLIEAGRAPEDRQVRLAKEFQLGTSRAFLSSDKVAVYAFEATDDGTEVKVSDAIDPKSGLITKSTFAPITQRLSQLFNAALDASEDDA